MWPESWADIMANEGSDQACTLTCRHNMLASMHVLVGDASTVAIPMRHPHKYQSLSEVSTQPDHVHCLPKSKTEESIDFICQPNELGQAMTNLKHGAKATGLRNAYTLSCVVLRQVGMRG